MRYRWIPLVLSLVIVGSWWEQASAQASWSETIRNNAAILTIEVLPLEAEVRLDGVLLGTARELMAQVVTIAPGRHVVQVSAPGHRASDMAFQSTRNWINHLQVQLVSEAR
jgi:hypothetical protein